MKKLIKGISLLGFSVLFLSGCGKSNSVNKVAAAPMNKAAGKETLDLNKLNPEERAQVEKVALDVKNLVKLTKEADGAFQEVWEVFLNQQGPNSLFKGISSALESGYSEDGLPLADSQNPKEQCKRVRLKIEKQTEIVQNKIKFQAPQVYSLTGGECSALPGDTLIYAMKDAKERNYFAIKHTPRDFSAWVGVLVSAYGFPAEKKAEAGGDAKQKPSFVFEKVDKAVRCDMYMNQSGKLQILTCANLGHDDTKESSVVFKDFRWNSYSEEQTIKASGLRVKVNPEKGPQVVSSFEISDSIPKNEIVISEKEIESGDESSRAVPRKGESLEIPPVNGEIAAKAAAVKQVKPQNEATSNEPVVQSGDQAVSPDQVGLDGEIVPLDQIDTPTQDATSVR